MPLVLPRLHILHGGPAPRALASREDLLSKSDLRKILQVDTATPSAVAVDRCLGLDANRWVIGRRTGARTVWRVIDQEARELLPHAAWLLPGGAWFDAGAPEKTEGPLPAFEPLRDQVRQAAGLTGSRKQTIRALGRLVAELRRSGQPVAAVVPEDALAGEGEAVRWFLLSLLSVLPPTRRWELRLSVGEAKPDPRHWDLVFTSSAPVGFRAVNLLEADDDGNDVVAFFVQNRLWANDADALEAYAEMHDGPTEVDAWGEAIRAQVRAGVPGISGVTPDLLERDPDTAARALRARLRAGVPLDPSLLADLVSLTRRTMDARPWKPLLVRPAIERSEAWRALFELLSTTPPSPDVLEILTHLAPPARPAEPWAQVLLRWMAQPRLVLRAFALLEELLLEQPAPVSASLVGCWQEALQILVAHGQYQEAQAAVSAPAGQHLLRHGAGPALIEAWIRLPREHRRPEHLQPLVDLLARAPEGGPLLAQLARACRAVPAEMAVLQRALPGATEPAAPPPPRPAPRQAAITVDGEPEPAWSRRSRPVDTVDLEPPPTAFNGRRTQPPPVNGQAPSAHLNGQRRGPPGEPAPPAGSADGLIRSRLAQVPGHRLAAVVATLADGPSDPLWVEAEQVQSGRWQQDPRGRFLNLLQLREGLPALEPVAVQLASRAIAATTYPDPPLAEVCLALLDLEQRSEVWPFVAITSHQPGTFDDPTIDATVVAFCESPPAGRPDRDVARSTIHALGMGAEWDAIDHARWLVRLSLAPDYGDGLNLALASVLMRALTARPDRIERVAEITAAFLDLPPDHPAVMAYTTRILPGSWPGGIPREVVNAVVPRQGRRLPRHWSSALGLE